MNYNFEHHRFLPGVKEDFPILNGFGLGFLCSGIIYFYLVRKTGPNSK
jgi:hypothetical protein